MLSSPITFSHSLATFLSSKNVTQGVGCTLDCKSHWSLGFTPSIKLSLWSKLISSVFLKLFNLPPHSLSYAKMSRSTRPPVFVELSSSSVPSPIPSLQILLPTLRISFPHLLASLLGLI